MTDPTAAAPQGPAETSRLRTCLAALADNPSLFWLILAAWTAKSILGHWNIWAPDLSAVYVAGWLWDHGQAGLIYSQPEGFFRFNPPDWDDALARLGAAGRESYPFIYPPVWAALMGPVTHWASPQAFFNGMAVLEVGLLALSVLLARRLAGNPLPRMVWLLLSLLLLETTIPLRLALHHLQPSLLIAFLVLAAFERLRAGHQGLAGALLGLAVCIKLTPLVFVALLWPGRHYLTLAALVAVCALLGLTSLLIAGPAAHLAFLDALGKASEASLLSSVNLSVRPAIEAGLAAIGQGQTELSTPNSLVVTPHHWVGPLCLLGLLLVPLWLARRLRPLSDPTGFALLLMGLAAATALFGPLGWQHYYVLPLLLLPALFARLRPSQALLAILPMLATTNLLTFLMKAAWPWPDAIYVWMAVPAWLALLAMTGLFVRPLGDRADHPC